MMLPHDVPTILLADGATMPQLGLGTWQIDDAEVADVVISAAQAGYRAFDTARVYRNERGVGRGLRGCGIERDRLHVTTKVWNDDQGYEETLAACDRSLERLGLDYVDLYLIHWPAPTKDRYVDTWRALVELKRSGRTRSIGVSNFLREHLERCIDATGVVPAVNQIELHPHLQQAELRQLHEQLGIVTQAYSPLGQGALLDDPVLTQIARERGRTTAQVALRWSIQLGNVVIPKSSNPSRIAQNIDLFDFELSEDEMAQIRALDRSARVGWDPLTAPF